MRCHIFSILFLILIVESECSPNNGFFISAPGVFHVGVNEKVLVQMGTSHLHHTITLYLEHEVSGTLVSEKKTVVCTAENEIKTVELMIDEALISSVPRQLVTYRVPYLLLVAESSTFQEKDRPVRKMTRVLVSKRKGNIFIQTDQPMYSPTQNVRYRIFTLDHTFRPSKMSIQISVFNAAGNTIMKSFKMTKGGILQDSFKIPDLSKIGTWKIAAHYENDEAHVAFREFKVQKFVLPCFEVNIRPEEQYILMNAEQFNFIISAKYSYGEDVRGAYHCQFGVVEKGKAPGQTSEPVFIKGLELTGSVNGIAAASLQIADLQLQLKNQTKKLTLSELQQSGSQLFLRVFVTNIQSGEIQEAEVYLPIVSHKYTIDLTRTRSYFLPGYPLNVMVVVRNPNGTPAAGVTVTIDVPASSEKSLERTTDQEGAVFPVFNIETTTQFNVEVSADGLKQSKLIKPASFPSGSFLYLSFANKMYSVGENLVVGFNSIGFSTNGFLYYTVLSRGIPIKQGSLRITTSVTHHVHITSDMVPSFRLIGYFYDQGGNIISDSIWVDVRDKCEINVKVEQKGQFKPGKQSVLDFDLHGQKARVALLAVDKAFYGLHADNKLTAKQVFSTMQSHDLGCSYGGGPDPESVISDAGLSFVSHSQSNYLRSFDCDSQPARQRRAVDLEQEMMTLKSNFSDEELQECCAHGFSTIPMRRTCQERVQRVSLVKANPLCTEAFLKCCLEGERLRQKKLREDARKELGRTLNIEEIEQFFSDIAAQYIRRYFPPSFAFTEFDINGKGRYTLTLPDSITTWEIQVVTLSPVTGFCVVEPSEFRAFKNVFVSLRLPYSVRKYEQLSISPVIYNYGGGDTPLQLAVHMEQTEGLCSPGSATTTSFVNITLEPQSSQFVSFSAVPMVIGSIPIKIRLYDIESQSGVDAIEKTLNVLTEGMEKRDVQTKVLNFTGRRSENLIIDGTLPDGTVPDTSSNIFISAEGDGFRHSHAKNLLSPEKVKKLIELPDGCLEQTMKLLGPTASAIRYLDLSEQWFTLPAGARDSALDHVEKGIMRILELKNEKPQGSYGPWTSVPYSNWMTALVVKVFSAVAERQTVVTGQQGRRPTALPVDEIRASVAHLLSVQEMNGSFGDPYPVVHRGIMKENDQKASMTAFITVALNRSLQFLQAEERRNAETSIAKATTYLQSLLEELENPYAVAITAYCLAACLPKGTDHSSAWRKLTSMKTEGKNGCYLWSTETTPQMQENSAVTVDSTAFALLTAVELGHTEWADKTACWLTTQENYFGGFKSSQDTINALEALAEYELKRSAGPEANLIADFTVPGRNDIIKLTLEKNQDKVETNLKKFAGNNITMQFTGKGNVKVKILKTYHLLGSNDDCKKLSISVTVEGKVKYTDKIIENYDYYEDYDNIENPETRVSRSVTDWFDAPTRRRRDLDNNKNVPETVTYKVCVSHNPSRNLSGMAIADITLLSGFEVEKQDLDSLKAEPERYISHYELSHGRVLFYFNELFEPVECISFTAKQIILIGLLQPAQAVFYDYYEPNIKCTVFYSAPKRSKMVSQLCSEDVCQCAERPCHKIKKTFQLVKGRTIRKEDRLEHACFFPTVDYAYIVEVLNISTQSNFELYTMNVKQVLKSHGDNGVNEDPVRVFAKRRQCKGQLDLGKQYLIMGKDGSTTDSSGMMQYLLESNTWVERKPGYGGECTRSANRAACRGFTEFVRDYTVDGCKQ